ncbi:hypothetical protein ACFLSX_03140 [Calditrichota bacterium]
MTAKMLKIIVFMVIICSVIIAKQDESEIIEEVQDVYEDIDNLSADI